MDLTLTDPGVRLVGPDFTIRINGQHHLCSLMHLSGEFNIKVDISDTAFSAALDNLMEKAKNFGNLETCLCV